MRQSVALGPMPAATPPADTASAAPPAPTPTTAAPSPEDDSAFARDLDSLGVDPNEVLTRFGLDPDAITSFHVSTVDLITFILTTVVLLLLLRAIYRGIQRPRLALTYHEDAPPSVTWMAIRRYLWTPILLVPLWYTEILVVLIFAANRGGMVRPPQELIIAAGVIVGGSRMLAHINLEMSHELAKSVPLTLITLILISGQTVSGVGAAILVMALIELGLSLLYVVLVVSLLDVVVTASWFAGQRAHWRSVQRRIGKPVSDGAVSHFWRWLGSGWDNQGVGPAVPVDATKGLVHMHATPTDDLTRVAQRMMLMPDTPEALSNGVSAAPETTSDGHRT